MQTIQRSRRRDPYPWSWELPLLGAMVLGALLAAGVQVGRSAANLAAGAGWSWPTDQTAFWRSVPAVLGGGAAAGLRDGQGGPGMAGSITRGGGHHVTAAAPGGDGWASPAVLWCGIGAVETVLLVVLACVGIYGWRRWGPGRLRGMADRAEAEQLLGTTRLRRSAAQVRPDLHRSRGRISGAAARARTAQGVSGSVREGADTDAGGDGARTRSQRRRHRRVGVASSEVGWRVGAAREPRGGDLWVPWDRTSGVIGPQGSGKTLDLLTPALLAAPGAALVTLTKVEDLLLSITGRARGDRPCVVLDPFGLTAGLTDVRLIGPTSDAGGLSSGDAGGSGGSGDVAAGSDSGGPGAQDVGWTGRTRRRGRRRYRWAHRPAAGRAGGETRSARSVEISELVWDPVDGCVDPMVAERRAKAFTAGTVSGAIHGGTGDDSARFYAAEAAKVLQCYLHAAALTGRTLEDVLRWVANPTATTDPSEILREHPHAAPFWHGLLHGALHGDDRTAGNTITTVQQAMSLFFQAEIRRRCIPGPGRPATDLAEVLRRRGTIYLLGREDPYASASPLMTAVAEHILDTGLALAHASPFGGRLCPPLLACLDELPSTAPLPTLRTRMANERALGLSFLYAAQTRAQLTSIFGEHEARALVGLTNVLLLFGGSKDVAFNQEVSDLLGTVRVTRTSWQSGAQTGSRTVSGEDIAVLRPEEIRRLPDRHALVIAENGRPILARLDRCLNGPAGQQLLRDQQALRDRVADGRSRAATPAARAAAALVEARRRGLATAATSAPSLKPGSAPELRRTAYSAVSQGSDVLLEQDGSTSAQATGPTIESTPEPACGSAPGSLPGSNVGIDPASTRARRGREDWYASPAISYASPYSSLPTDDPAGGTRHVMARPRGSRRASRRPTGRPSPSEVRGRGCERVHERAVG